MGIVAFILAMVLLVGAVVIISGFYAAVLTAEIIVFLTGLKIIMSPAQSCIDGCLTTLYDSKPLGWMLMAVPVLTLLAFLIMRYGLPKRNHIEKEH